MTKKPLREITLNSLKVGMYITKLDIPWINSPFLSNSKKIKSTSEIAALKKSGAQKIIIDPNRGLDLETPILDIQDNLICDPSTAAQDTHTQEADQLELEHTEHTKPTPHQCKVTLNKAINEAKNLRKEVKKTISNLHDDIAAGSVISGEALNPLIDQTLESLAKNNQALLNLIHLSKRSQKLADHTFSTFCLALNLAQKQAYPAADIEALGIAALLHESGWTHLPINLMGKRLPYTQSEKKLIANHPTIGLKSLGKSKIPTLSLRIIAEHHERNDGSGYPNKLKLNDIHPLSQLFAVVDQYDAMVHQLRDRPAKTPNVSLRELYVAGQKKIYDLGCVEQLIALLGIYPISSAVMLSDKRCGIVREVHSDKHLQPLVEIIIDAAGKLVDTPYMVDLSAELTSTDGLTTQEEESVASSLLSKEAEKTDISRASKNLQKTNEKLSIASIIDPLSSDESIHRYLTLDI